VLGVITMSTHSEPWKDPELLESLYWGEDMPLWKMAERWGCDRSTVGYWMNKHGIDKRGRGHIDRNVGRSLQPRGPPLKVNRDGYEVFSVNDKIDDVSTFFHHQLLAIADGADPDRVFDDGHNIHHINRIPWDNRTENLEVLTKSEHAKIHYEDNLQGEQEIEYTDDELLDWIEAFIQEFGVVPSPPDVKNWPGPSVRVYQERFGSWTVAIQQAGYTARSER